MSKSDSGIHCSCGHPIRMRDLAQMILGVVDETPTFVFVKFRCPSCQREEWQQVSVQDLTAFLFGPEAPSSPQPEDLGAIDIDEIIDFHQALENLTAADLTNLV